MGRVLYSVKSHRKIVHLTNCKVIQRIPKENRRTFDTLEEAFEHGYHLCNCCPSMAQKYRKEKKAVDSFCKNNQLQLELKDGVMHITSPRDFWRIIIKGKNKSLLLYHKNTYEKKNERIPSIIPGYHSQAYRSDSILGYLKYIIEHDAFRAEHPCTESTRTTTIIQQPYSAPWVIDKYGEPWNQTSTKGSYKRIKGTKRYRKEQEKKKRQEHWESIARVNALIEALGKKTI